MGAALDAGHGAHHAAAAAREPQRGALALRCELDLALRTQQDLDPAPGSARQRRSRAQARARELEFEEAARLRDEIESLRQDMLDASEAPADRALGY